MMKMDTNQEFMQSSTRRLIIQKKSCAFVSEHSNFFYLKIEQTNAQQFEKQTGHNLWHRRTGHSTNHAIRASIKCTTGMDSLVGVNYEAHVKCPSCMLEKATLEEYPGARGQKVPPLYQINMDSFSSSIKSIEGYNHAVVLVDNQTGF